VIVKSELHTISIRQTTHQDLVQKSGLRRILFDKSCLRHILFPKKIWPMAHFSAIFFESFCAAFDFKFSIYQFIGNGNDLNSNYDNTK